MVNFGLDAGLTVTFLTVLSHLTSGAIGAALPQGEISPLEAGTDANTWYHLQSFGVDRKYHKTKPSYVSFTGGDGYLTKSKADAAKFWIWGGQLGVDDQFVHLDFVNGYAVVKLGNRPSSGEYSFLQGEDGWLHVQGQGLSYGEDSQAVFCQSEDGSIFLQGHGKPPFPCHDIGLSPRTRAGPAPRSLPPRQNKSGSQHEPAAIPTVTTTITPRSVPAWWASEVDATPATAGVVARSPQRGGGGRGGGGRGGGGRGAGGRGGAGRGGAGRNGGNRGPTRTRPNQPNPSSDNDLPGPFARRSFEFDMDGESVD